MIENTCLRRRTDLVISGSERSIQLRITMSEFEGIVESMAHAFADRPTLSEVPQLLFLFCVGSQRYFFFN